MSNIYIQEPPTSGKVLLKTTVGDIDIELWSRECPLACRNFVQLCAEGYYNGTVFHRLVKGFIVQGGDPNGDGTGGESIYGHPFRDEFHSRLRFVRRGLVGMANSGGKHDNGSQFFFTLGPTQELQNVHTLFGKVAGDTIYNMLRLEEGEVYENERPHFPAKILKTEVLHNPFPDIVPRVLKAKKSETKEPKKKEKGVKNYGLLSFGDEAEEEEQETNEFVQKSGFTGKSKSSHDVLDDPKLSKEAVDVKPGGSKERVKKEVESGSDGEREDDDRGTSSRDKKQIERDAQAVRDKLKRKKEEPKPAPPPKDSSSDSDSDFGLESERKKVKQEQAAKIRDEISKLKKDYQSDKRKDRAKQTQEDESKKKKQATSEVMKEFLSVQEQYSEKKKQLPKKGSSRENFTLQLLEKFKNKLHNVQEQTQEDEEESPGTGRGEEDVEQDIERGTWLSHRLQFEKNDPILAKDAVTKDDDWYDVYDPRNPLNKRKRGEKVEKRDKARK